MARDFSDFVWNPDMEVNLFHAMRGHKPVGVNKHFQMISIHDRLSSACKKITSDDVWNHLSTLYDLQALNESEIVPFPNKNGCFDLLESDVSDLCEKTFPRTPYINNQPTDSTKTDSALNSNITPSGATQGASKSTKAGKLEPKALLQTPKTETKTETKPSTSKAESRANTPSGREPKTTPSNILKASLQAATPNAFEPSPKRTKRTRNVPSANASPATPTEPPTKRRR
ncbi:unnamed protein product [Candidula unifasciata]|uniref:MRG-binding protein n=1 Tax=Candidula unifasciata TaxID=100452 RepID=A0A8S3YDT4_9EUPU|nr:unnamed protein product [Candidula unifasciata]